MCADAGGDDIDFEIDDPYEVQVHRSLAGRAENRGLATAKEETIQAAIKAVLWWNTYYRDENGDVLSPDILTKLILAIARVTIEHEPQRERS